MNTRPELALAVLTVDGKYALQLRDNNPAIEAPGLWGMFGGHLEAGELPIAGVMREVKEELCIELDKVISHEDFDGPGHLFSSDVSAVWHSHRLTEGQGVGLFSFHEAQLLDLDHACRRMIAFHHYTKLRRERRIVMCHGVFDVFHYGHVLYLMAARKRGDYLIVSLVSDRLVQKGPGKPVFNERERAALLRSIKIVDEVILTENIGPHDHIREVRPHVYCKGIEYKGCLQEEDTCNEVGSEIYFIDEPTYSSSRILDGSLLAERASKR